MVLVAVGLGRSESYKRLHPRVKLKFGLVEVLMQRSDVHTLREDGTSGRIEPIFAHITLRMYAAAFERAPQGAAAIATWKHLGHV